MIPPTNIITPTKTKVKSSTSANAKKSSVMKPYNNYNIFFLLERVRFVEARKAFLRADGLPVPFDDTRMILPLSDITFNGYGLLELPPLPPRFAHLESIMPLGWYVPGMNKQSKRKHTRSHGVASFKEISTVIAANWKTLDPVTKAYVEAFAKIQKDRYQELKKTESNLCLIHGLNLNIPNQGITHTDMIPIQYAIQEVLNKTSQNFNFNRRASLPNMTAPMFNVVNPIPMNANIMCDPIQDVRQQQVPAQMPQYQYQQQPRQTSFPRRLSAPMTYCGENRLNIIRSTSDESNTATDNDNDNMAVDHYSFPGWNWDDTESSAPSMLSNDNDTPLLDQLFSNDEGNTQCGPCPCCEVDLSDEQIISAYHSAE